MKKEFFVIWLIIFSCIILLTGCKPKKDEVQKFVSKGESTYMEIKIKNGVQKIYTEMKTNFKAVLILGERNNAEIFKLSFFDSTKMENALVFIIREKKDTRLDSEDFLATNKRINSLSNPDPQFEDWKKKFTDFINTSTGSQETYIFKDSLHSNTGVRGNIDPSSVSFRIKDFVCYCENVGNRDPECSSNPVYSCSRYLCMIWDCIESGNWTESCRSIYHSKLKPCLGVEQ